MGVTLVNNKISEALRATDCAASVTTRSAASPGAVSQQDEKMNALLQEYDRVTVVPVNGPELEAKVTKVERRAIGFNYFAKGTEPGRRGTYRIAQGVDGKWYEASAH